MGAIQETKQEDKSFRKRANMLSDIQSMIIDYKKKSQYSNLIGSADEHGKNQQSMNMKAQLEAQEM